MAARRSTLTVEVEIEGTAESRHEVPDSLVVSTARAIELSEWNGTFGAATAMAAESKPTVEVGTKGTTESRGSVVVSTPAAEESNTSSNSTSAIGGSAPNTRGPTETEWGSAARPCSGEQFGSVSGTGAVAGPQAPLAA